VSGCGRPDPGCALVSLEDGAAAGDARAEDASGAGQTVLIYSRTTGWRHESIEPGRAALTQALTQAGYVVRSSESLSAISRDQLTQLSVLVLLSTTGEPLGADGSAEQLAVRDFVQLGGGLLGVHSVTDANACGVLPTLIGATFRSHPGNIRNTRCTLSGPHPTTAAFAAEFAFTDEIHTFWNFHPANNVLIRCASVDGQQQLPVAWWRELGGGRIVVNTLGHDASVYADPTFMQSLIDAVGWVRRR
jgi:type 1 glutamine amidotransferase